MEHPKEAVEAVALALCHIMHGHENIDDLGLLPRQLLMRRADMICNLVEPHYREQAAQIVERAKGQVLTTQFGKGWSLAPKPDGPWVSRKAIAAAIRKGE